MFLNNLKMKFANHNGFTTIELMLVIVILAIISIAVSNVYSSGFNFFISTSNKADIQREIRFIADYITENVKYADKVELVDSMSAPLATNEKLIGLDGTTIKYKEYGLSARSITNTPISNIIFEKNNEYLTVRIVSNNYELYTKILLNNCTPEVISSDSKAIRFLD